MSNLYLLFLLILLSRAVQPGSSDSARHASETGSVCVSPTSPVGCAGMNMPLHQISVIPRDVTSSRVSGSGKSKDKQVGPKIMVF